MKKFSGWSTERVNRQIAGNDDRDGVKDGAIDVARGVQQNFVQLVILAMALAKLAINVFHHDDGAINDDAEVDSSDREKVRCFAGKVEKNKSKQQSERDGKCGDDGSTHANQKKDQDNQNQNHSAKQIAFYGVGGDANQIAAVVVGPDANVARKQIFVDFLGLSLHTFENDVGLLAAAHEYDAFDGIVIVFGLILKTENAEARGVADFHVADVADADRRAVIARDPDFADIVGGFYQPQTPHIIKLAALRIKTAAGIGVVVLQRGDHLHDRNVIAVHAAGIEKNVILHGGAAETGIVGNAGHTAISALDDPALHGVEFLRRAGWTLDDVTIDEAAGTEERRHAGGDALGEGGVAKALENELPGRVGIDAFMKGEADVGEARERDCTHQRTTHDGRP